MHVASNGKQGAGISPRTRGKRHGLGLFYGGIEVPSRKARQVWPVLASLCLVLGYHANRKPPSSLCKPPSRGIFFIKNFNEISQHHWLVSDLYNYWASLACSKTAKMIGLEGPSAYGAQSAHAHPHCMQPTSTSQSMYPRCTCIIWRREHTLRRIEVLCWCECITDFLNDSKVVRIRH